MKTLQTAFVYVILLLGEVTIISGNRKLGLLQNGLAAETGLV